MNVFIVFAHPEPRSLSGSLRDFAVDTLREAGHRVCVSDLYAMRWKASADGHDFHDYDPAHRLDYVSASATAFEAGTQTADIEAEQEKLLWADVVILQFPMWWFTMPAILKGWVERVYAFGFGYGVGEHNDERWGERFGEGTLAGRRSMVIVTAGGKEPHYSARGVNGPMDDLLFPIHHGVLFYPGMEVLPPFVVYGSGQVDERRYQELTEALELRLLTLESTRPIPFRAQNGGDYELPSLRLKPGLENPGVYGLNLHVQDAPAPDGATRNVLTGRN